MFGKFGDMAKLAKTAMEQSKKLAKIEASGESANGKVKIRLNGKMELINVIIDEEFLDPSKAKDLKKSLIKAHKDAMKKIQKELSKSMNMEELMGALGR